MKAIESHFARPLIVRRGRCARRRGLTLLEVILALALTILLLSGVYGFYASTLKARDAGYASMREILLMGSLLNGMAEEIRHTTDMVPGDGNGFKGTYDSITIVKLRMPERYAFNEYDEMTDDLPPAQMDIERTGYQLLWDEELVDEENVPVCHGLWRTHQKTFDPNPSFVIEDEELAGLEGESEEEAAQRAAPRIEGEHTLTIEEMFAATRFDDVLYRNLHEGLNHGGDPSGFDVPLRGAIPKGLDGMLVCGRGYAYERRGHDPTGMRARLRSLGKVA